MRLRFLHLSLTLVAVILTACEAQDSVNLYIGTGQAQSIICPGSHGPTRHDTARPRHPHPRLGCQFGISLQRRQHQRFRTHPSERHRMRRFRRFSCHAHYRRGADAIRRREGQGTAHCLCLTILTRGGNCVSGILRCETRTLRHHGRNHRHMPYGHPPMDLPGKRKGGHDSRPRLLHPGPDHAGHAGGSDGRYHPCLQA